MAKPDWLARSTADLLTIVGRLEKKGVGLIVLSMGGQTVDTRTATGRQVQGAGSHGVLALATEGMTREGIAKQLGIGVTSVYRILAASRGPAA